MRILAVRGRNLASLADPFAIDLSAEPLEGAGLFAITGETGAGKSTLLDALCLALYGEFPRVADGSDQDLPDVADQTVKAKDPRNILRKGASQGLAEVDFVAIDGRRYRASWAVHRARGRPGGQLQPVRHLLVRIDDAGAPIEGVADKTSAVKARVVELTDLTFDQFRRTVVLAQGEFDAFLRAADADRADLLEKITGTEIYARLSKAAHEADRAARETVERARERRAALGLFAPDVRADKEVRHAEIETELATLHPRREAAAAALAAHDRAERAAERTALAEAAVAAAEAGFAAADDERARAAAIEAAHALRPVIEAQRAARREEAEAFEALTEAEGRLKIATPRLREAGDARHVAQEALRDVDVRIAALRPQWDDATRLDVRLAEAHRRRGEAETPAAAAAAAVETAQAELARVAGRRGEIAAALARLAADRDRHPELAPVVEHWREIAERFQERVRVRDAAAAARTEVERAVGDIAEATTRLAALETAETERRAARVGAEARLAAARDRLVEAREEETRARDDALARLAQRVAEAAPTARERAASAAAHDLARTEEAAARAERDRRAAERPALIEARDDLARRLAEGAAADRLARAMDSAEAAALRATLVEATPCPVCGATDHPILADPSVRAALAALRAERAGLEARAAEVAERLADGDRARSAAEDRLDAIAVRLAEASRRRDAADAALRLADAEVATAAGPLGLPWADFGGDPAARLAAAPARLREARAALAGRLDAAVAARTEIDRARAEIDRLDAARVADADAVGRAVEIRTAADRRAAVAAETERNARSRLDEIDARLAAHLSPLGIGAAELDDRADTIVSRLAATVAARRAADAEALALAEEEKTRAFEEASLRDALARAEADRAAAAAALAGLRAAADALAAERAGLLDGEATQSHRARVEDERRLAVDRLDAATAAFAEATREHDAAMLQIGERRSRLAKAEDETGRATADCRRALAARDLDWERAAALLAVSDDEVAALRARLAALGEARARAVAEAEARRADLAAARAEIAELPPRADVAAADAIDRDRLDALNREIGALREALAADDAARARAREIEAEIASCEEEAAVWAAVGAAVGSADGSKFRRFAQGVTLDRLAALADRHLATLAPRYRLVRTDGLGLAIVDRDMGEETRSTRSLSGGERFLASLALALALSGLEGRRSFVDTLFIDEGFGSLDQATLDVAIDALESLQSEGRKVGVISHVAAMHERIPVQIRVTRAGLGLSRVAVVDVGRERA